MNTEKISSVIKEIYKASIGCKSKENILIFSDDVWLKAFDSNKHIFQMFYEIACQSGFTAQKFIYDNVGRNGAEPPAIFWNFVFGEEFCSKINFITLSNKDVTVEELLALKHLIDLERLPDAIVALAKYSTSHTIFRKFLNQLGVKYASMPNVEEDMFYSSLAVDYEELKRETLLKKSELEKYNSVVIKNPLGTELFLDFTGRTFLADTGDLTTKGSFGNLPAGEVFIAPNEDKTEGVFFIEYAVGQKLDKPLAVYIEKGTIVNMDGDSELKNYLIDLFSLNEKNATIAELGIGTNKLAKNAKNILEAEKIYNTCHIAIGDNSTFGGQNVASVHLDFVIFNPTLRWN